MQIAYGNENLDTIQSQANVSQNSFQTIDNTHSGLQPLVNIIVKCFDNIQINESSHYLKEVSNKECQEETA